MANTGNFIYNILEIEDGGVPVAGSPFTVPIDATAGELVELTGGVITEDQANNLINTRIISSSPTCTPACLTEVVTYEYPAEAVLSGNSGESIYYYKDAVKTCMTFIKQL